MKNGEPGNLPSFVARIWLEHSLGGEKQWRGHIRVVQNGRNTYFQSIREVCDFLEQVSGVPVPPTVQAPRTDS